MNQPCRRSLLPVLLCLFLLTCGQSLPQFTDVDLDEWKHDPQGCKGSRSSMIKPMEEQRSKLLRLSEMQVIETLGKPDINELYKRNQKFYRYYMDPSPGCKPGSTRPKMLVIRFTAMGVANEVSVE